MGGGKSKGGVVAARGAALAGVLAASVACVAPIVVTPNVQAVGLYRTERTKAAGDPQVELVRVCGFGLCHSPLLGLSIGHQELIWTIVPRDPNGGYYRLGNIELWTGARALGVSEAEVKEANR